MVREAKNRARRSIIIDHGGAPNIALNEFRNVEQVYTIERDAGKKGIAKLSLLEFMSERDADEVSRQARHNEGLLPVPMKIFRHPGHSVTLDPSKHDLPYPIRNVRLSQRIDLNSTLKNYSDIVSKNTMSLVALKMRFITLVNIEQVLCSGLFGEYELMPFGSSVIDTGSDFGDLDLVVTRKQDHDKIITETITRNPKPSPEPSLKLLHLDKSLPSSPMDVTGAMSAMRWFDTIIREYMPLTDNTRQGVLFLPHAKVPIIRFKARTTSIDCDLSFNLGLDYRERDIMTTNYSGIIMSQILYDICRKNNLFTAVVIYFRIFAKISSITSKGPNVGFTNFQLLSLIIFYLQRISIDTAKPAIHYNDRNPIIPPFEEIMNSQPIHLVDEELDVILPKVIKGFFEYYSKFKFSKRSLNLHNSRIEKKPDNSHLYVVNPLDRSRNICHNVCRKGLDNFIEQCKQAYDVLSGSEPQQCPLSLMNNLAEEYQQQFQKSKALDWGQVMFENDSQTRIDQPPKRLLN